MDNVRYKLEAGLKLFNHRGMEKVFFVSIRNKPEEIVNLEETTYEDSNLIIH